MTDAILLSNVAIYSAQVACVAGTAALLSLLLRIDAAAVRYAYWRAVLAACVVLPWIQPREAPPAPHSISTASSSVLLQVVAAGTEPTSGVAGFSWATLVGAALVAGAALRLLWIGVGLYRVANMRHAGRIARPDAVHEELQCLTGARAEIRYVEQLEQPVTFGVIRPVILLPETLCEQPAAIHRAVLCHELIHVRQRDWAWVLSEELIRAALWFHPIAWWLIARVQLAREEAVDQRAVLLTGARRAYMKALLTFADGAALRPAAAFGRRRHLFRRMVLISQEAAMSPKRIMISCAAMTLIVMVSGWAAVSALPMRQDASGGTAHAGAGPLESSAKPITPENPVPRRIHSVPAAYPAVALSSGVRGLVSLRVTIDDSGRVAEVRKLDVSFAAAPADAQTRSAYEEAFAKSALDAVRQWQYAPPAEAPIAFTVAFSFRPDSDAILVSHDTAPRRAGGVPPPPPPPPPAPPWHAGAVHVGGDIQPPQTIKDVKPVYPAMAMAAKVQGVVLVEARIEPDGRVGDTRVLRSVPLLDQAAIDAVRQWEFTPTLVEGRPVPVIVVLTMRFSLK